MVEKQLLIPTLTVNISLLYSVSVVIIPVLAYEHIIQRVHLFFDTDITAAASQYSLWKWHHCSHHIIVIATCRGLQYCFKSCKITVTKCLISMSRMQTKGNCELIF